jgi:hypothetical protein
MLRAPGASVLLSHVEQGAGRTAGCPHGFRPVERPIFFPPPGLVLGPADGVDAPRRFLLCDAPKQR